MYFAFNIGIYDRTSEKIYSAMVNVMKDLGFYPAGTDLITQALQVPGSDLIPQIDEQLMLRKFLISPNRNKWCVIYPSTGWFSEIQDLGVELSKRLDCMAIVLLVDDSYGWGYELSQHGQIIDKFHTEPMRSPTLQEKHEIQESEVSRNEGRTEEHTKDLLTLARLASPTQAEITESKKHILESYLDSEQLTPEQKAKLEGGLDSILANLPTLEQKAKLQEQIPIDLSNLASLPIPMKEPVAEAKKYVGKPSVVAKLFGISEEQVIHYLSSSQSELEVWSYDKMMGFFKLLGIEGGDGSYQNFLTELDDNWQHLIFARKMTPIEWHWYEKRKEDFPFIVPPLWLNE